MNKKKFSWKSLLTAGLAILLCLGAVAGVAAFANRDTAKIGASEFSVGGLDPLTGKFVDRQDTIYTVEAFSAQGLKIVPDFEAESVEYQVFFYDENGRFLEATDILIDTYAVQKLLPTYARVVIYPSTLDDEGNMIEDFKISRFGIRKIANLLTITVDADQDKVFSDNLFEVGTGGESAKMAIKEYDGLLLKLPSAVLTDTTYTVTFYANKTDAEGVQSMNQVGESVTVTLQNYEDGEVMWYTVDAIPSGATHATINYFDTNINVGVYGIER